MMSHQMLKDVFCGKKKLFKLNEVKFIHAPKYDEISVKSLYPKFIQLDGMNLYFPDKYAKGKQADREYMFNIANTLYPEQVEHLINHALS